MIDDHLDKVKKRKKTHRYVPSKEFIAITEVMTKMLDLLDRVKLKPAGCEETFKMKEYYSTMSQTERCQFDTENG